MQNKFLVIGCILAALAVALGAFGAHGLKAKLAIEQLNVFETAVRYQFYHTFAILLTALLLHKYDNNLLVYAGFAFLLGILFFCGSLYLLSTRELIGLSSWKWLGPITPLGGLCFIIGWIMLAIGVSKG